MQHNVLLNEATRADCLHIYISMKEYGVFQFSALLVVARRQDAARIEVGPMSAMHTDNSIIDSVQRVI